MSMMILEICGMAIVIIATICFIYGIIKITINFLKN